VIDIRLSGIDLKAPMVSNWARPWTLPTAFAALPHLEISSSREETSFTAGWLGDHKLARRIALRAPFLSAARILVQSDAVATFKSPYRPGVRRQSPPRAPQAALRVARRPRACSRRHFTAILIHGAHAIVQSMHLPD